MTRRLSFLIAAAMLAIVALTVAGSRWATARAQSQTDAAALSLAHGQVGLLASELQKFRLLPLVLAEYPDVSRAMAASPPDLPDTQARLNRTLELLAGRTDAAAIYAIDRAGRTVAASNWRLPTSFVGQNYGFRPYFAEAMARGASELFALGTVSGRPGLYLARRVDAGDRPVGVVVVKVEFDAVEASWARAQGITLATDAHGVVLVTSIPAWRFTATGPLDDATLRDARRTLQFGATSPGRAPVRLDAPSATVTAGGVAAAYRVAALPAPLAGGRLLFLMPLRPALVAARTTALLWSFSTLAALAVIGAALLRSAEKRRLQHRARAALEREVVRRTAELRDTNDRLVIESDERAEAERRYRAAREELAQANRLGSLGQIVAGVAHEINQPVAAIRTYAENGSVFLDRNAGDRARENLSRIVGLADRIGAITAELRAFARRKTPAVGKVELGAVLDGVGLLMGAGRGGRIATDVPDDLRRIAVVGDRTRLEQVLVNLLQNALEAVPEAGGTVMVTAAQADATRLALRVADNGCGIAPALHNQLFTPFATGKADGLGLGLAIARNIAREFGGDLMLEETGARGATFLFLVQRA